MKKYLNSFLGFALIMVLSLGSMSNDYPPNPTCDNPPGTLIGGKCVTGGMCLYGFDYPDGGCYRVGEGVTGNCYYHFTCTME